MYYEYNHYNTLKTKVFGKSQNILQVALSRPKVKNAFNDEMYLELTDMLRKVSNDDSIHAIVLTGDGDYFSSGADLQDAMMTNFHDDDNDHDNDENEEEESKKKSMELKDKPVTQFMLTILTFSKLLIAAINGPAIGIAVTILLHCDVCYCTPNATFWTPFVRIAFVPEFCSSFTFVQRFGLSNANELLLLGKKWDADRALSCGLVSGIYSNNGSIHSSSSSSYCGCNNNHDNNNNNNNKYEEQSMKNITNNNTPFHSHHIASFICSYIDQTLFSHTHSDSSSKIYIEMMRLRKSSKLKQICLQELSLLNQRFQNGQIMDAVLNLNIFQHSTTTTNTKNSTTSSSIDDNNNNNNNINGNHNNKHSKNINNHHDSTTNNTKKLDTKRLLVSKL